MPPYILLAWLDLPRDLKIKSRPRIHTLDTNMIQMNLFCVGESTRPYDVFVLIVQKNKLKRKIQDEIRIFISGVKNMN